MTKSNPGHASAMIKEIVQLARRINDPVVEKAAMELQATFTEAEKSGQLVLLPQRKATEELVTLLGLTPEQMKELSPKALTEKVQELIHKTRMQLKLHHPDKRGSTVANQMYLDTVRQLKVLEDIAGNIDTLVMGTQGLKSGQVEASDRKAIEGPKLKKRAKRILELLVKLMSRVLGTFNNIKNQLDVLSSIKIRRLKVDSASTRTTQPPAPTQSGGGMAI